MSPTGDASLRAHRQMQSALHPGDALPPPAGPDDLTRMASGDDELADMADGEDELSEMASGRDELSAMASEADGSFEDEVNAELAGAKVVFDHGKPVIAADMVEVIEPGEGAPEVIEHPPTPSGSVTTPQPAAPSRPEPQPQRLPPAERGRPQPNVPPAEVMDRPSARQPARSNALPSRVPAAPSWQSIPGTTTVKPPRPAWGKLIGTLTAIPFLLIFCLFLGVGRGAGGFAMISLITFGMIVYLLVRAAGLTGRKTTTMPRDDSLNRRQ